MTFSIIEKVGPLQDLRDDWTALAERRRSPLLEFDWHHSCATTLHYNDKLHVVVQRDEYHRVIDNERTPLTNSHPGIIVSDDVFEMHMRTLRHRSNPMCSSPGGTTWKRGRSCLNEAASSHLMMVGLTTMK